MAKASFSEEELPKEDTELTKAFTEGVKLREKPLHYGSQTALNKRSMILDEENFEEIFLRCNICKEHFRDLQRIPKLLPCHHSFCLPCIQQLYRNETDFRQNLTLISHRGMPSAVSIHCPICRGNFLSTEENLRHLPTDHRVVQLLDFVKHTERCTVTFCSKHSLLPLNFFCELCIKPVCRDCTVLDHKEQDGHMVMDLNEALEKYLPVLDSAVGEMETESNKLEEKRVALQGTTAKLDKIRQDLVENIQGTFERLRTALNERERELQSMAENEVNKEKIKLDEKVEMLSSRRRNLLGQAQTMKTAKEENNVEQMFTIHEEFRGYKSEPPIKVREVDDRIMTTFAFNSRDEQMLSSRIANFGDISSQIESTCPGTSRYPTTFRSLSYR